MRAAALRRPNYVMTVNNLTRLLDPNYGQAQPGTVSPETLMALQTTLNPIIAAVSRKIAPPTNPAIIIVLILLLICTGGLIFLIVLIILFATRSGRVAKKLAFLVQLEQDLNAAIAPFTSVDGRRLRVRFGRTAQTVAEVVGSKQQTYRYGAATEAFVRDLFFSMVVEVEGSNEDLNDQQAAFQYVAAMSVTGAYNSGGVVIMNAPPNQIPATTAYASPQGGQVMQGGGYQQQPLAVAYPATQQAPAGQQNGGYVVATAVPPQGEGNTSANSNEAQPLVGKPVPSSAPSNAPPAAPAAAAPGQTAEGGQYTYNPGL
uniref:Uncharacterized protein n=1 Tax=Palpitomonas bilix TaxID=652834 RepID=A0A7S3G2R7_9EUKA